MNLFGLVGGRFFCVVAVCYGRMGHGWLLSYRFCESGGCAKFCCSVVFPLCLFVRCMLGNSIGSPSIMGS